jgi:hypothetical protein
MQMLFQVGYAVRHAANKHISLSEFTKLRLPLVIYLNGLYKNNNIKLVLFYYLRKPRVGGSLLF